MMTILFDEAEARGKAKDIEIGEARGIGIGEIRGSIKVYKEDMGMLPEDIVKKIMAKYSLAYNDAKQYVKDTLN